MSDFISDLSFRGKAWQQLLRRKGLLTSDWQLEVPVDIKLHVYLSPATTDINSIVSIAFNQHVTVDDEFIVYHPSAHEEEYYLWDDVQCVKIKRKKK